MDDQTANSPHHHWLGACLPLVTALKLERVGLIVAGFAAGAIQLSSYMLLMLRLSMTSRRWTYLSRTIPDSSDLLQPLEGTIHQISIPSLTSWPPYSKLMRDLIALPVWLGGLSIINPATTSRHRFHASEKLTAPLMAHITSQDITQYDAIDVFTIKQELGYSNHKLL